MWIETAEVYHAFGNNRFVCSQLLDIPDPMLEEKPRMADAQVEPVMCLRSYLCE